MTVNSISGSVSSEKSNNTVVRVYYSTISSDVLRSYVEFDTKRDGMDSSDKEGKDIDNLLRKALIGNDANGIWYVVKNDSTEPVDIYVYDDNGNVTGINENVVNYDYSDSFGEVSIKAKDEYEFYNPRLNRRVKNPETDPVPDNTKPGSGDIILHCYKMFRWLDTIEPSKDNNSLDTSKSNFSHATCVYAVTEKLGAKTTLSFGISFETKGNEATNLYGNIAHSWKQGDDRNGLHLTSNQVSTRVVGRELSGLVWEDLDHDGIRKIGENGENLIEGMTCTLLKWNGTEYKEVKGNEGANGREIEITYTNSEGKKVTEKAGKSNTGNDTGGNTRDNTSDNTGGNVVYDTVKLTTGRDGSYRFSNLADGDYVVAFSDNEQNRYDSITLYQTNDTNDSNTNDGVAVEKNNCPPGLSNYQYYIKYSKGSTNGNNIKMYTLEEMKSNTDQLKKGVQSVENQDIGLYFSRPILPNTGGSGTDWYVSVGIILMAGALVCYVGLRRKKMG